VQLSNRLETGPAGGASAADGEPSGGEACCAAGEASTGAARATGSCCAADLRELLAPQLFRALADPRRLSLLVRLADERRPCTVGQLADGSGVDLSVVSRHLAVLREAGVITCEKRGKEVWCTVQTGAVAQILRDLADALETCCPPSPGKDPS
jgi:DNA-binding transcriptional ArsR family regulator